jgi:uncharacterized integral membrane protein (TIGR00697 family)
LKRNQKPLKKTIIVSTSLLKNKQFTLFLILAAIFIGNTLVAEVIGVKIFSFESTLGFDSFDWSVLGVEGLGMNLTAGVILWPVVFVMTDIINEYFGEKNVKFLSYVAIGVVAYSFIMIYGAIYLSPNEWWDSISGVNADNPEKSIRSMDLAFKKIMGQGLWIIVGSMVAFLVGQVIDVVIFHKIKKITGEKKIWLRATGSTLVSQFIDSFVVLFIAFYIGADWELIRVLAIGIVNYIYKFSMAILLTPLIYLGHFIIDRYLGEELADKMKADAAD